MKGNRSMKLFAVLGLDYKSANKTVLIFCLIFTIVSLTLISGCDRIKTPPAELIGIWETDAPKYKNRYIEITNESLIFGVDDGDNIVNKIKYIKLKKEGSHSIYTFHYIDPEGGKWTLSLIYDPYDKGMLTLQNRDEVWIKYEH